MAKRVHEQQRFDRELDCREGQGAQGVDKLLVYPTQRLQFNFRHQKVSQEYLPAEETLTDAGVRADYWVRSNISVSTSVQYERWLFPAIQPGPERNVVGVSRDFVSAGEAVHRSAANSATASSEDGGRP